MKAKNKALNQIRGEGNMIQKRLKKSDEDYAKGKRHYLPPTHSDTQYNKQEKRFKAKPL